MSRELAGAALEQTEDGYLFRIPAGGASGEEALEASH